MSTLAVARRYAAALVELTSEKGSLEAVEKDLGKLSGVLGGAPALRAALLNPAFKVEERKAVLETVLSKLGSHEHTRNFLFVLNDRNRLGAFDAIVEEFGSLYDTQVGRVRANITSAKGLDAASVETLRTHLQKITGAKDVLVTQETDPTLIGGIVTRIGDLVLDGSVRTQLKLLRDQLTAGDAVGEA
ncbi:MAG: ATP synthase F1 subunit delta [Deltaproteobacteria bacterium]|nr:ATP synthase F1 subunit delta [Deltaproteobacteria bacterium]